MTMNPTPPDLGCKQRTEPVPPVPHGLVADVDATLGQQVLDRRSDSGNRTYIITVSRMISGELLKYRRDFVAEGIPVERLN